jgi:hypothetical protein
VAISWNPIVEESERFNWCQAQIARSPLAEKPLPDAMAQYPERPNLEFLPFPRWGFCDACDAYLLRDRKVDVRISRTYTDHDSGEQTEAENHYCEECAPYELRRMMSADRAAAFYVSRVRWLAAAAR